MPSTSDARNLLLETRPPLLRAFAQKSRDHAPLPTSAIERSIHEHDLESICLARQRTQPPAHATRRGLSPRQVTTPCGAINRAHQTRGLVGQADGAPRAPRTLTLSGRPRDVELHPSPVRPEHPLSRPYAKTRLENLRPSRTTVRQTRLRVPTSGPPHLHLRDKEQDPPHPGCLPRRQALLQELGKFSTGCPQTVDYLPAPL
jgi:hypothetical protein